MDPCKTLFMSGDIAVTFTWKITIQTRGFPQKVFGSAESWAHISSVWLPGAAPWQSSHSQMVIPESHPLRQRQCEHISWISHTRKRGGWRGTTVTSSWCPQYLLPRASAPLTRAVFAGQGGHPANLHAVMLLEKAAEQNTKKPKTFHHLFITKRC